MSLFESFICGLFFCKTFLFPDEHFRDYPVIFHRDTLTANPYDPGSLGLPPLTKTSPAVPLLPTFGPL